MRLGVMRGLQFGLVVVATGLVAIPCALADEFFKGKEITLLVGSTPGGPYDAYARMVARYMGRHIPGAPSFVVVNMPGASGRKLMGYVYNSAPKDGTVLALAQRALAFDPLMGVPSQFDPSRVSWLGSANTEVNVCMVWHTSRIQTIEDVKKMPMVVGSGGPASTDTIFPNLMNYLFGAKFKVIGGYKAASESNLAMERGEIDGRCGITWDTLQALNTDWLDDKKIRILVQIALDKHPDLPDVPWVFDMATTQEQRQILTVWTAPNKMGRPFFGPPAMPADRLEMLRRAFDATMADPALRAEVAKTRLWVNPITGEAVEKLLHEVYQTPPDVVAKAALAGKGN
jgi:tripartite-type tricarboxylate transporter receptor subunit TctC